MLAGEGLARVLARRPKGNAMIVKLQQIALDERAIEKGKADKWRIAELKARIRKGQSEVLGRRMNEVEAHVDEVEAALVPICREHAHDDNVAALGELYANRVAERAQNRK